jgi:anti-sigma regulatory factor (Ser/Thr protein kinase)
MAQVAIVLPSDPSAPAKARELLGRVLDGSAASERLALCELALSEVVTNAVRHGGNGASAGITVSIAREDDVVRITVVQPGPVRDVPSIVEMPEPWSTNGYGLSIVDAVTDRWGVHLSPPSVWFELGLRDEATADD